MSRQQAFFVDESKPWFQPDAGWPGYVPKNIEFPDISLYELLRESAEETGDAPVLWFLHNFMTYQELIQHVDRFAAGLKGLGVSKGDVVALAMPNSFQYPIAYYACSKLGAIVTGVNPLSKPVEILHQLKSTGARTLVTLDAIYQPLFGSLGERHTFERIIATNLLDLVNMPEEQKAMLKKAGKIPTGAVPDLSIKFTELLKTEPAEITEKVAGSDVAAYVMTGGTTGFPKVAILTHFNCVSSAISVASWLWDSPGACLIGILPLFHVFGMAALHTVVKNRGYMLLFPQPPKTEELVKTVCAVGRDHHTFYPGAEVLFQQLIDFPDIDKYPIAQKINKCLSSAGPLRQFVKERFERKLPGVVLREGYGLSEASSGVAIGPYDKDFVAGSIGLPLPGVEWKIVDISTGERVLPPGETGELILSAPMVMAGYLENPQETADALREKDGKMWLFTGDLGYMDEYGRVFLNDRKKQLIKVKGYSVFPTEVEQLMSAHDCIQDIAVAGLPDAETGEAVKAWVVLKEEWQGKITPDELRQWAKTNITHYKVPKHIEFIQEIPKSLVGKVLRRELQEADPLYKAHRPAQ
jgi:long-chain acyl-CoA synthetase